MGINLERVVIDKGQGDEFDPSEYTLYLKKISNSLDDKISKLMLQCNLGQILEKPTRVNGGLSHRMYRVVTDKGIYAVKELNKGIMKRKDAYSNFVFSEKVTDIVKENHISAIGAIKIDNDIMVKIEDTYFMIFNWIDGKILNPNEITIEHCKTIGTILAQIHNIDFSSIEDEKRKQAEINDFNWSTYLKLAQENNKKYTDLLEKNIDMLYRISQKSIKGIKKANEKLVISHTDLDRKNVMWNDETPYIINWEASGYINPFIELVQVAWCWSGGDALNLDYIKFKAVVDSYKKHSKINIANNIDELIYANNYGGLNWLEYNLKRSMCIENNYDNGEIELAENEVINSLEEFKYKLSQILSIQCGMK